MLVELRIRDENDGEFVLGCRKWHPDRNPDDKENAQKKFREVGECAASVKLEGWCLRRLCCEKSKTC